ncbi:response regulator [Caulobacter sp. NIBR1757]|uniref:response regulator n=1 Tax=Caulobacter sp. NIBR1757 TaxID=3016000 RepID=UPI0022F00BA4|nr:response regulator [Caulobacter sp. NIBR1757]WGM38328.1 Chemotaxis protein CheY [Caulobacter sp. NIBR1757]
MPAAASISTLIVDDQLSMRALIRAALIQIGITNIREAPDGEDGLRALAARPAHLVISDYNMPKLDGLGLLRAVRSYEPLKGVAFIMLTGRADIDLVARARQFGVNNYLIKPFNTLGLKTKIEEVFGVLE